MSDDMGPRFPRILSTDKLVEQVQINTLEFIIAKCKEQRLSIGVNLEYDYDKELEVRQEGFRGALAWVEGRCCDEINRIRGVLR